MPEGRLVKRKITDNYRLNSLPVEARLLYFNIILWVDREGRLQADSKWINRRFFNMDNYSDDQVAEWLQGLHSSKKNGLGLIELYEVDELQYLWLPGFEGEQSKSWVKFTKEKEAESSIPPPPSTRERRRSSKPVATETKEVADVLIPTPFEEELLEVLKTFPGWDYQENEDLAWLRTLTQDFQNVSVALLKGCCDHHSENPRSKGPWKNRIRNWLTNQTKFEKEKVSGTHRGSARTLPKTYKSPSEHDDEYHQRRG